MDSDLLNIVMIMISCVLANHMGLISGIERVIRRRIPILNCVKCSTFWSCLIYMLCLGYEAIISITISFILSYVAIWVEFGFGIIDICYEKFYNRIYKDSTKASDGEENTNYSNT